MNKSSILQTLAEEYKRTIRLPDDISLRDYKDAIERATGLKISDRRAAKALDEIKGFTSLIVVDRGKVIRVWRESPKEKRNVKTRNSHQSKPNRTRRPAKKDKRGELTDSVSV